MPGISISRLGIPFMRGGGAVAPDGAPSALILTVDSDTEISGTFTIGSTNHDGHYVYYSDDNITYVKAENVEAVMIGADNTFQVTGLTANTLYYFYVVAYKGDIESSATLTEQAQTWPTFGLYANFFGANNLFADGNTIAAGTYGVKIGNLHVKDLSTGEIAMIDNFMEGFGSGDWTNTIFYGDPITLDYGRVFRWSISARSLLQTHRAGLCKTDFSDVITTNVNFYIATAGGTVYIPAIRKFDIKKGYYEYEIAIVVGGFDASGVPYTGGSKAGFNFGFYMFIRAYELHHWFLGGFYNVSLGTSIVPYFSFYSTDTSPYESTAIIKMMTYSLPGINVIPTGNIALSNNDQFLGFDIYNTNLFFVLVIADGEEVNLYFCIDDYTIPTDGYRLKMARSTTTVFTLYRLDDGTPTTVTTSTGVSGASIIVSMRFYKGLIWGVNHFANFNDIDISAYSDNTKAKIVDDANSHITQMIWYPFGKDGEYREALRIQEPFFVGENAPGLGLPGETRKGHYFDVSSQTPHRGVEVIGAIAYLVNGSDKMRVRYRSHSEERWIGELDVMLNLQFAYSGTDAIVYIASDPHFGYADMDATLNYEIQIIPDITALGVTHCFILGDIVHDDAAYYATYIAAKGLYPSATWKELNGNHDVVADFKTDLGYADESHIETIGNCTFIMCGSQGANTVIDHTFLGDSLTTYAATNCFIMTHSGRLNTTELTDLYPALPTADIETAVGVKKFVAWFAGHQHGWERGMRKIKNAKYLDLGDNN